MDALVVAFPGRFPQTLGLHIYQLHHTPQSFGVENIDPLSLQILHVAAHIDTMEKCVRPALEAGKVVILDRYWWSTKVYGLANGVAADVIDRLIEVELLGCWREIKPETVFLVRRKTPLRNDTLTEWERIRDLYDVQCELSASTQRVDVINNDSSPEDALRKIVEAYRTNV